MTNVKPVIKSQNLMTGLIPVIKVGYHDGWYWASHWGLYFNGCSILAINLTYFDGGYQTGHQGTLDDKLMPPWKGLPVPMTTFSSRALDKQVESKSVLHWPVPLSTLPAKTDLSQQAGWTQVSWATLHHSLEGKKNNLTQPSMRRVLGAYTPKSFPLKG